jgi:hypothetical protein
MHSPHLHRKLQESLGGDDAGEELGALIDRIDPIRGDIAELRHSVQANIAELRHDMKQGFEKAAKEQLRFLFLAWAVLLAAIVGLYGR